MDRTDGEQGGGEQGVGTRVPAQAATAAPHKGVQARAASTPPGSSSIPAPPVPPAPHLHKPLVDQRHVARAPHAPAAQVEGAGRPQQRHARRRAVGVQRGGGQEGLAALGQHPLVLALLLRRLLAAPAPLSGRRAASGGQQPVSCVQARKRRRTAAPSQRNQLLTHTHAWPPSPGLRKARAPVGPVGGDGVDQWVVVKGGQVGVLRLVGHRWRARVRDTSGGHARESKGVALERRHAVIASHTGHCPASGLPPPRQPPYSPFPPPHPTPLLRYKAVPRAHLDVHDLRQVVGAQPHLARPVVVQVWEGNLDGAG